MFVQRLISGIVLLIIMIGSIAIGGNLLLAVMTAISLIGLFELYRVLSLEKQIVAFIGYGFTILLNVILYMNCDDTSIIMLLLLIMLLYMVIYVLTYPRYKTNDIALSFFSFFYVSIMLSYIYQVRDLDNGIYLVWLIFISAWGSDTCAYCTGMLIGKHKLPNELSPKKSIEGCIGGIVGSALLGFIYATIFKEQLAMEHVQWIFAVIGAFGSVLSQIGDLAASAIKRNYQIKDYGQLIPGHGGILDRFDSIIFTAPIVFILLQLLV